MLLLLIDNEDSFTYNLAQAFHMLGAEVKVVRNNALSVDDCEQLKPERLVVGPGPGCPQESGISKEAIRRFCGIIPILGVCLGHQCIAEIFGGQVIRSPLGPMHGKTSEIQHSHKGIFQGLQNGFIATRYHSLVVEPKSLPDSLEITALSKEGEIMGLAHRKHSLEGVQFHPESVLTTEGSKLLKNYLTQGSSL